MSHGSSIPASLFKIISLNYKAEMAFQSYCLRGNDCWALLTSPLELPNIIPLLIIIMTKLAAGEALTWRTSLCLMKAPRLWTMHPSIKVIYTQTSPTVAQEATWSFQWTEREWGMNSGCLGWIKANLSACHNARLLWRGTCLVKMAWSHTVVQNQRSGGSIQISVWGVWLYGCHANVFVFSRVASRDFTFWKVKTSPFVIYLLLLLYLKCKIQCNVKVWPFGNMLISLLAQS